MPDYADDDYIFDTQWLAMKRALNGNGILSGMDVTEQGPPAMAVDVAAGLFYQLNNRRVYAGGSVVITAAEANDRWDIIVGDAGGITYHKGTAAIVPKPDNLGAAEILIAMVYVATGTTAITNAMIFSFGFQSILREHGSAHENGGSQEINVGGLSGILADLQPVKDHDHISAGGTLGTDSVDTLQIKNSAVTPEKTSGFDKCGLVKSTNLTVPVGIWTNIAWNVEDFDTNGLHAPGSYQTITKKTGYYLITCTLNWAGANGGVRNARLYINNAIYFVHEGFSNTTNPLTQSFSIIAHITAPYNIFVRVYHTYSVPLVLRGVGSERRTNLTITLLPI